MTAQDELQKSKNEKQVILVRPLGKKRQRKTGYAFTTFFYHENRICFYDRFLASKTGYAFTTV